MLEYTRKVSENVLDVHEYTCGVFEILNLLLWARNFVIEVTKERGIQFLCILFCLC